MAQESFNLSEPFTPNASIVPTPPKFKQLTKYMPLRTAAIFTCPNAH